METKTVTCTLLDACREGSVVEVRRLLPEVRNPADVRDESCQNKALLHYSCYHGWLDMTKKLVEQYRCDPESKEKGGDTPLHVACHEGHVDIVRYLVSERGCNATQNNFNKRGDSPLHVACHTGQVEVVKYLVSEQKCVVACKNGWGDTPLHEACKEGHLTTVKALSSGQDFKAACDYMNTSLDTPLSLASCKGHVDIVRYLVGKQGCMHGEILLNDTPLHKACRKGHLAMVEALTSGQDCKAACNYLNDNGHTPLHVACYNGHVDIVRYLVSEQGCSICTRENMWRGDTPLHVACRKGHLVMVKALTSGQDCKPACNCQDSDGNTPLHVASIWGNVDIVRYLVEQGSNMTCHNKKGDTPLHEACRKGHLDIVRYLVSEQGCITTCKNNDGDTPLHDACREGHVDIVRYLVSDQGCSTSCQNEKGDTPLHVACSREDLSIVRYLVSEQGCSTTRQNRGGDTPLQEACREGHLDIVRYLVNEWGCSTTCQNNGGDTPLHEACRGNRTGVVKFLLSTGRVNPWCKNYNYQTPLQVTTSYEILNLFASLTKDHLQTVVLVFGHPAAGKSTLVEAIENKFTSRFGATAGQFRNVSGVELKTAGISTVTLQSSRFGTVTIYDLAGQFEYYYSHGTLVETLMSSSAAIFIAVVKLSDSEAEVIRTLRYWISFIIENCCSTVKATAHLMVVGSLTGKVKEAGENIDQKWSNIKTACISSTSSLHFVGFTSLDCRKLASSGLDKICDTIVSSCTALRKAKQKEIFSHLLHAFISTKLSTKVAFSVGELCDHIRAEQEALLPTEPNLLSPLLSCLSDGGHLLYLPNKKNFEVGWVVTDKQTLLSEINGTVFAPKYFKQHHNIATSTGVVPKSKIAGVFAEKYNIDTILCVLTLFQFCWKIEDSFTVSLIASCDPKRDGAAAMTTSDESSESYYFFPALVRVQHPTDIWRRSGPGQYQCGWCLQCTKEGQYLTPQFLHMLLLRLAFSFALAPDSTQQDEASPVLRRRCAIWKNGIQWLGQNGVETIVEVSEQNKLVLLLMSCPKGEEMACVRLRSSLVSKILETKEELCPGISTTELLIDPSNLSSYPLPSSSELTLYRVADQVVKAIRECEPFAVDITGRRRMKLVQALHFEPYLGLDRKVLDHLFCKYCVGDEVSESFLLDLAGNFCPDLEERVPMATLFKVFTVPLSYIQNVYGQFPDERDNHVMRCLRLLVTWKDNFDTGGSTYQSLRTTLDKYSIFSGRDPRDPVSYQLKLIIRAVHF